ncbi:MAG: ComF family protein [Proteobacteria bacterium]|nr:ComF family protein [Pseudomonadota bacterium]
MPFITDPACLKCGLPHDSKGCADDWTEHISRFQAIFAYESPVQKWIGSLKYSRGLIAGKILQDFVKGWFLSNSEYLSKIDILLSVPIHPLRLRQRGFNQAAYLLNTQRRLPNESSLLRKIRRTPHQASLSRADRKKNLRDSFEVAKSLEGKTALLFDDVCTTGQTLGEIAKCLKRAQAERIDVLVLGRAFN